MPFSEPSLTARLARKAHQVASDIGLELGHHMRGHYPGFVHARKNADRLNEIPVFVYHTIDPVTFEADLRYLDQNGYRTITCDEYLAALTGDSPVPAKVVMLTIDDGRYSVYRHAAPLLQRYGMVAVTFLIPGYMQQSIEDTQREDPDLMSWDEVAEVAATGCMDFQSHTGVHHRVPAGPVLEDFVHPGTTAALFDIPVSGGDEPDGASGMAAIYGYPVFKAQSRMLDRPAFVPDAGLIAHLREVASARGETFFTGDDWRATLFQAASDWQDRTGSLGRYETSEETANAIRQELIASREQIEARLPGHRVRHLCLPYTIGSDLAVALAKEAGFESCFWGVRPDRRSNIPVADPMYSVRLKGDFLRRLPGEGRQPLAAIFWEKVRRRLQGEAVY